MLNLLSFIWYWLYRLAPGEWLCAIGMGWWGLIKYGRGATPVAYIWWGLAVLLLILARVAAAMGWVIFRPTDAGWRALSGQRFTAVKGVAAGEFLRYSDPYLRIPVRYRRVGQPVLLHWYGGDRPPYLALFAPDTIDALNRNVMDNVRFWSFWYPGSDVRQGMVYINGRERPGLEFAFAGRRTVVALEAEEAVAAVQLILAENA